MKNSTKWWCEIKADFDEKEGLETTDDIISCINVDAWKTEDQNEEGKVIAKIIKTKSGDTGVVYINNLAQSNEDAQVIIREVLCKIKS